MTYLIATAVIVVFLWFSAKYKWWRAPVSLSCPRILMYHMVREHRPNTRFNGLRVPPKQFEKQIKWLADNGWNFLFLSELMASSKSQTPEKTVVVTFDDGYEDNFSQALPILKKYNAKATLFLVEERFDNDWSVKKKAHHSSGELKEEPKLSDAQVKEMIDSGCFEIGGHSLTHANFASLEKAEKIKELNASKEILEQKFNRPITTYAYPFGIYDDEDKELVAQAGYSCAVTTEDGIDENVRQRTYDLKRIKVSGRKNFLFFKLSMRTGPGALF